MRLRDVGRLAGRRGRASRRQEWVLDLVQVPGNFKKFRSDKVFPPGGTPDATLLATQPP